jgi:hypothetical protein
MFLVFRNINPFAKPRRNTGTRNRGVPDVTYLWWMETKSKPAQGSQPNFSKKKAHLSRHKIRQGETSVGNFFIEGIPKHIRKQNIRRHRHAFQRWQVVDKEQIPDQNNPKTRTDTKQCGTEKVPSTKSNPFQAASIHKLDVKKRQQNQRIEPAVKPQSKNNKGWKHNFK